MVERPTTPTPSTELASGDREEVARAQAEIRACEAKLKLAADEFAESDDDTPSWCCAGCGSGSARGSGQPSTRST